jgi:peroxiredoxin
MSIINTAIKPFKATAYHGGKFVEVTEASLKGKWAVVVFYPADFTFVCPTELGDLADHYAQFKKLDVEVYSVSTDTHFTHKAWHDSSATIAKVKYPLIADPTQKLARGFQVLIEEGESAGLAFRGTFVIDPDGKIKTAEMHDNSIGRDASELLRRVKAAQMNRVMAVTVLCGGVTGNSKDMQASQCGELLLDILETTSADERNPVD